MTLKPGQNTPFQICLSDTRSRKREWYLQLQDGFKSAYIDFMSPDSNNIYLNSVGKKIGDFDEQRNWKGGRGGEFLSDDPTKFFDSLNCWTLSTGHVTPTLLWQYATGYRGAIQYMPGVSRSVSWQALTSGNRYVASEPLGALTAADKAKIWIRRIGSPGTLTLEIRAASAGNPNGAVRVSATVTTSTITDVISVLNTFNWTGTQNITAGDFLVVYGASSDTSSSHWEIGVDRATSNGKSSANGTAWSGSTFSPYYRITDTDIDRRWFFFQTGSNFCAVDKKASGASQLYTIDAGAAATEKPTTGLGTVSSRPVVAAGGKVYFPQGEATNIRTWDGAVTFADDGTNKATFMLVGQDAAPYIALVHSTAGSVSSYQKAPIASPLVPGTTVAVGTTDTPITGIGSTPSGKMLVFKTNSIYKITNVSGTDVLTKLQFGIENTPSPTNGVFALPFQQFLYFPWLFSLTRYFESQEQLDDVGQGWDSAGLPAGREGSFAAGVSYVGFQFYAVDGGTGTSCVLAYDGVTWHEVFRAPEPGLRIMDVAIQPIDGTRSKLWIDLGGDLVYITLPYNKARPIDDSGSMYMHEGVLYSSTIDNGAASKLKKLINSLTAVTANLNGAGIRIECEYQVDDNIGKDGYGSWIPVEPFMLSPESTVEVNANNITQFRYRLRLMTDNNTIPPDLKGMTPNGLARGETKIVFSMQVKGEKIVSGGKATDPNELLAYLIEAQQNPGSVRMTSTSPLFGGKEGIAVELSLQRIQPVTDTKSVFALNLLSV